MEGGSFDGQYFHLSVPAHLTEALHLSNQFICTWDPLHKGGVEDNHIREDSSFSWFVEIQTICREIFSLFNWGKKSEDLNVQMKKLTNFQMTRFANSVRFVFINLRIDYSAVRLALVNVIASKENSSAVKDRSMAEKAKCVLRKINSSVFCLSLSGCADICNVYGIFSNICQEANLLPHERLDRVQDVIAIFLKMMKALDHSDCPGKCLWPRYHADLLKMESQKTFMGSEVKYTNFSTVRQTRLHSVNAQVSAADGIGMVKERLSTLTWRFHNDLANEVFHDCTKEVIENCRVICDLKSLPEKIYQKGSVMVGLDVVKTFLNAVRNITGSVATVDDGDLMNHYPVFVASLETLFIKSCKEFDPSILDSKEIIESILKKENIGLFRNVKVIIHLISVESVVESLVSRYEKHFDSSRQPTKQDSLDEIIIAENEPLLHHADEILERAMNQYWRVANRNGKWHFLL